MIWLLSFCLVLTLVCSLVLVCRIEKLEDAMRNIDAGLPPRFYDK